MNFRSKLAGMAATCLLSTVVYAQTPATGQNAATNAVPSDQTPLTKKAERAANRAFAKRVQRVIYKTKGLEDSDIVVFAKAMTGHVTLSGFVLTEDQDRIATAAARKVQGVTAVKSLLTLQEQGS
jgi:hyperosmotically inducible protein